MIILLSPGLVVCLVEGETILKIRDEAASPVDLLRSAADWLEFQEKQRES